MRILFLADPPSRLKPQGDSTLALVRTALKRKHEVFWTTSEEVEYDGEVGAWIAKVTECSADGLPVLAHKAWSLLPDLDAVLIRKDPPFDANYVKLCWILSLAEPKVFMLNRPSLLLRYHEKLVPLEAVAHGYLTTEDIIPTFLGPLPRAQEWARKCGSSEVITKPFLGFGGTNIQKWDLEAFCQLKGNLEDVLVQPYHEEVTRQGDRRVFFVDGKILAQFTRMPKAGDFVSNLAQGGSALSVPLAKEEEEVLVRLGKFLKSVGVDLAGADLIGTKVSEVNVTSPTGLRSLEKLEGRFYSEDIIDFVEKNAG